MMPLVRIGLARGKPPGYRQAVADVIYTAMTGVLNVPNDDRFMVITEHDQADLVISPEYLGIGHTADVVLIQVTRNEGRTVPVKWDFYRAEAMAATLRALSCRRGTEQMRADPDEAAQKFAAANFVPGVTPLLQGTARVLCGASTCIRSSCP
jgi:4-oxalocrotonate tautomerase